MDSISLPETYKALVPVKPGETPRLETLALPRSGYNQILVKVAYAPINPSDINPLTVNSIYGGYIQNNDFIGVEGSGIVVSLGRDLTTPFTIGQKVHITGPGTMAQYILLDSFSASPVQEGLSLQQAAPHIANSGMVLYMASLVEKGRHKAAIHTAGSSALGRMWIRYFKEKGIKTINIVRRDDYTQELKEEGADYVLNSTAPDFESQLKEIAEKEKATIAFDAIAGEFTNKVLTAQPAGSICYVYGSLSGGQDVNNISIMELFKGKQVTGLYLTNYVLELTKNRTIGEFFKEAHSHLTTTFKTNIQKVYKLEDIVDALAYWEKNSSKGKILLQPNEDL